MGPFPTVVRQLKFSIVAIDYFTKWVKTEALATITEKNIRIFVWRNIICLYRIPRVLIFDNGKQFDNSAFRDFYLVSRITTRRSHTHMPMGNLK